MSDTTLEVKAPQDVIDILPQERITGDILRGRGPRRGNLEHLLKFWRPIMRKPGGFRRCIIILANHPELYPLQPLCAWLHHETTGKWPNEGNHHGGGRAARAAGRVARRAVPGKRRRRRRKSDECGIEIASWRIYRRMARKYNGLATAPIAGSQNAVEYKAARFMAGVRSVPMPGSFDWDENHPDVKNLVIEEKVGLVRSHGRLGRALQSLASFFIPGDMGKFRSPIRSAVWGSLTPGGGTGAGGRGGLPSIGGAAMRCPTGYINGGRFTDPKLSNCGGLVLDAPSKGPGAVTAADKQTMMRRFQRGDDLPGVDEDVVAKLPKDDPFAVIREAATKPKSKPNVKRRDSVAKDVDAFAKKNPNTTRLVRRDGAVYEPRVGPEEFAKIKDHDNFADGIWVTSKIPRSGGLGGDEVRLLTKGIKSVHYVFPEGTVELTRKRDLSPDKAARMRTRWAGMSRDPEISSNPISSLERFVTEFKEDIEMTYVGGIKKGNERIVIYDINGMRKIVPRWVFQLYLSERAPRRISSKKPHYLSAPQVEERGRRPEKSLFRPERAPYAAMFVQQKALYKYTNPLPVTDFKLSDTRISHTFGLNKDSLIEAKASLFVNASDNSDVSVKVFGRRRRGIGRVSKFARRLPKVVPYDPDAPDGDNDGLRQDGTIWERPAGTIFRGIVRGTRRMRASGILVDGDGNRVDYKPGDNPRSPLRTPSQRAEARRSRGIRRGDRIGARTEVNLTRRDRERIAEGEAVSRDRIDQSFDRARRRVLNAMGTPERRRERAGRQRERAERTYARAQTDIERSNELRRLREERDEFDRQRRELEERHAQELADFDEDDPRSRQRDQRRELRRTRRRERAEEFAEGQDEQIEERDRRLNADVDFGLSRRERRRQRARERAERFAEGQDRAIAERDRRRAEEGDPVDRRNVDTILGRILRGAFGRKGLDERRTEDNERVREETGRSVDEHMDALVDEPNVLSITPEEEAQDVQAFIEEAKQRIVEGGESLPDDRSLRNVRNRFPQRGLPERAFWRDDDYDPGQGRDAVEEREIHDRRFGRYYDEDGNINKRGRLVDELLRQEREEGSPDSPDSPAPPAHGRDDEWAELLRRTRGEDAFDFVEGEESYGEQVRGVPSSDLVAWLNVDDRWRRDRGDAPDGISPLQGIHEVFADEGAEPRIIRGDVGVKRRAVERELMDRLQKSETGQDGPQNITPNWENVFGTPTPANDTSPLNSDDFGALAMVTRRLREDRLVETAEGQAVFTMLRAIIGRRGNGAQVESPPPDPAIEREFRASFTNDRDEIEALFRALQDRINAGQRRDQLYDDFNNLDQRITLFEEKVRNAVNEGDLPEDDLIVQEDLESRILPLRGLANDLGQGVPSPVGGNREGETAVNDRIARAPENERVAQRQVEKIRSAIIRQLGQEAFDQMVADWAAVDDGTDGGRSRGRSQVMDPIMNVMNWDTSPPEGSEERTQAVALLFAEEIWGDNAEALRAQVPEDASAADVMRLVDQNMHEILPVEGLIGDDPVAEERVALLRGRIAAVVDAFDRNANFDAPRWDPISVRARREWREAGMPADGELLEQRILTQFLRSLQNRGGGPGELAELANRVQDRMDNWDADVMVRLNPANEPGIPDRDKAWLDAVVERIIGDRMRKVRIVAEDRAARDPNKRNPDGTPKMGLSDFGIDKDEVFAADYSLTPEDKDRISEFINNAYMLGDDNRFTAPNDPDTEFRMPSSTRRGSVSKSGGQIEVSVSSDIEFRKKNADGTWGQWTNSGSTGRTVRMKGDGTATVSNGSMFNSGRKGLGFATVYNSHPWHILVSEGLVGKVKTGPQDDGPIVWGRMGFDSPIAVKRMVKGGDGEHKGIMGEIKKFDRGEPSILLSQEQREEAQRLVEAWHRDPSNVSVMMFHSVLQASIPEEMKVQGKHPWEWNNTRGEPQNQGLQGGARMGARDTQYGQWFLKNASVGGLNPVVEFNPVVKDIYRETLAQIRGGRPVTRPGGWTAEEMRQWRVDNPEGTPPWLALGAHDRIAGN